MSLAISLGVCIFNDGYATTMEEMFQKCGLLCLQDSIKRWESLDNERVETGNYRDQDIRKEVRRKKRRQICKKQDGFKHIEGVQYASEQFHAESNTKRGRGNGRSRGKKRGQSSVK